MNYIIHAINQFPVDNDIKHVIKKLYIIHRGVITITGIRDKITNDGLKLLLSANCYTI